MDKYRRYYGVGLFALITTLFIYGSYNMIMPKVEELTNVNDDLERQITILESKRKEKLRVENNIKKIKDSIMTSQKKVFSPIESNLGDDTLFFTMYNDVIEMVKSNSVKVKSVNYTYDPKSDAFVKFGKDAYFVCDIDMDLVSNYKNLGKLIQDLYQYPYYIKINQLSVKPYERDKKILLAKLSIRLYAHSEPQDEADLL